VQGISEAYLLPVLVFTYLLALACAHGGQLATLDARLITSAVRQGAAGLCVLK
jgi:hypothetical protein